MRFVSALGRPVKWIECHHHERGQIHDAEIALDRGGRISDDRDAVGGDTRHPDRNTPRDAGMKPGPSKGAGSTVQRWRRVENAPIQPIVCNENNGDFFEQGLAPLPEAAKPDF